MKIQLDGFFLYLCKVLSAYHVRLAKRMVQKNIIAQFLSELLPRYRRNEQTLSHWSGRTMRKLQHMW